MRCAADPAHPKFAPSWFAVPVDVGVAHGHPDPQAVGRLLRLLPDWFGLESAVLNYIEAARSLPTYLAVGSCRWRRCLTYGPAIPAC